MKLATLLTLGLFSLFNLAQAPPPFQADPSKICDDCAAWNKPRAPEKVFGNTYYVGTAGLSAVLVTSPAGHILLDGGLPQSAPLIDQNIRTLGFKTTEVRYILTSHGHYDHVGGIAALQRASGAKVAASASTARALERGENTPDDPQFGFGREANAFPPVKNAEVVADGQVVRVGDLAVTAHIIPGHAPGSTAWTWRSCEGATCRNVVYADSLSSPSAEGFRYSDDPKRVAAFRRSIDTVASLPCDILLAPHPGFAEGKTCQSYAQGGRDMLERRLAEERKGR
jgi:metallo-beta-lactamase class B